MKKIVPLFIVAVALLITPALAAGVSKPIGTAYGGAPSLVVDGKDVSADTLLFNDALYVKVGDLADALGYSHSWNKTLNVTTLKTVRGLWDVPAVFAFYPENPWVPDFGDMFAVKPNRVETTEDGEAAYIYDCSDLPEDFDWGDYYDALTDNDWYFFDDFETDDAYIEMFRRFDLTGKPVGMLMLGETVYDEAFVIFAPEGNEG